MKEFVENNKQDRKNRIINSAIQLIAQEGFSNMNLDQVVNLAGTSKSAVYELFNNKEGLLKAVCDTTIFNSKAIFTDAVSIELPVEEYLSKFVDMYVNLCHQPDYVAVIRAVYSELSKSPNIGKHFFSVGPNKTVSELTQYFALKVSQGELKEMDCSAVAKHMIGALVWYQQSAMLCVTDTIPDISEMQSQAKLLFETFMQTYAVKKSN